MSISTAAAQETAQTWLMHSRSASAIRQAQFEVLLLRLAQLVAQISAFWFLAAMLHLIVVEQQAAAFLGIESMMPFLLSVLLWGGIAYLADAYVVKSKQIFESKLEHQVHRTLYDQQVSLSRRFSSAFWQHLLLTNVNDVGNYHFQYTVQKYLSLCAPVIVLVCVFPIHYVIGLCLLFTLPIVPLFMILVGNGAANLHRKHFVALERLGDLFADRLKGLSMITANKQHEHQLVRLQDASNIVNRKTMKVVSLAFLSSSVLDFFATVSIALIAVFIGFSLLGEINIGPKINLHHGLFMLLVAPLLFSEMRALGKFYHQKAKAEAAADRFSLILPNKPMINESDNAAHTYSEFTGIAWLNYRVNEPFLNASKLTISVQDWILLEGKSGAGKTALLEALMGFKQASHSINADIAILSQQSCLLDNTLAFNLTLGNAGYTNQQLEHVLNEVGLGDWFAQLRKGLSTQLGDCPEISGGEAQRLALARILLSQKSVVFLDEPCAHLSAKQRCDISELIHQKLKHKTVIWVSHTPLPRTWFKQHWVISDGEVEVLS